MPAVSLRLAGQPFGPRFKASMDRAASAIARATTLGARQAALAIEAQSRRDIAAAGRFGPKWTEGLAVDVEPKSGYLTNATITISHKIPFATVFEFGATIHGKPYLWVPLSGTGITMKASDYAQKYGLIFVQRIGGKPPLLISRIDHQPKYVGVSVVHIRQRFHLRQIAENVMRDFAQYYNANLAD